MQRLTAGGKSGPGLSSAKRRARRFGQRDVSLLRFRNNVHENKGCRRIAKHAWTVLIGLCCIALLHPSSRRLLSADLTTLLDKMADAAAGIMPILVALQAEHSEARAIGDTVFAKLQDELGTRI